MNNDDKIKAIVQMHKEVEKEFGKGVVVLEDNYDSNIETISTGSLGLDIALGVGGLPKGRIVEIYGPESCLTGDTIVKYRLLKKEGKIRNTKGGTLKTLYEKFNNLKITDKYKKKREPLEDDFYTVPSINEENRIVHSKILDVVYNGKKEVFKVTTLSGNIIKCTLNHKFYIGYKYEKLEFLKVGDVVHIHNNTPFKVDNPTHTYYKEVYVKYHPKWRSRIINGCTYFRNHVSRATFEAHQNNMSYIEYINLLNSGDKEKIDYLWCIPENYHIHHIDENINNNSIENLVLISSSEHGKLHSVEKHNNLRFVSVPDQIVDIEYIGLEDVYDIKCEDPYHNYIANNFVVHNCGKTTLAIHTMAEAQKKGGIVGFIDVEHAFDSAYAKNIGVDLSRDKFVISQPDYGEQALEVLRRMLKTKAFDIIVVDSVAALVPKSEIEGEIGDSRMGVQARMMSQTLRIITPEIHNSNTCVIFINQLREKIGVMFGSPLVTTGGNALKFYASVRLSVTRSLSDTSLVKDENAEKSGNLTKVSVIKNKVAPPFKSAEFNIIWGRGIDRESEVLDFAIKYGVIKKSGSWFSDWDGNQIGQGKDKIVQIIKDNPEFYKAMEERLLETLKK